MKVSVITTKEFFSGRFTDVKPNYCTRYGWSEDEFKGLVYEAFRFDKPYYLITAKSGDVVCYSYYNGELICIDWCKPSKLFPEFRAALNINN